MGSIFGVVSMVGAPIPTTICQRMWDTCRWWKNDGEVQLYDNHVFLCNLMLRSSNNTKTGISVHDSSPSNVYINGDIKLHNRKQLLDILSCDPSDISDEEIILQLYLHEGIDLLKRIKGIFAFVLYDGRTNEIFAARDHMGNVPFNYHFDRKHFVFGTQKKSILTWKNAPFEANWEYICGRSSNSYFAPHETFYKDIYRLEPGHYIHISNLQLVKAKYWDLDVNQRITYNSNIEYEEHFNDLLIKAIAKRTPQNITSGAHMSGGLDSSVVASIANKISRKRDQAFHTFSYTVPPHAQEDYKYFNENPRVHAQTKYANIENAHYVDTPIERDLETKILDDILVYDGIAKSFNLSIEYEILVKAAECGVKTILSGFPGDEMVTSRRVPEHLHYLAQGQWWKAISTGKKLGLTSKHLYLAMMARNAIKSENHSIAKKYSSRYLILRHDPIKSIPIDLFDPQYLQRNPNLSTIVENPKIEPTRYDMLYSLEHYQRANIQRNHTAMRMESEYLAGLKFGLEYRYPLVDIDLLQFFLAIPMAQKISKFFDRYLFRRVARRYVIPDIYNSPKVPSQLKPLELYRQIGIMKGADIMFEKAKDEGTLPFLKDDNYRINKNTGAIFNTLLHLHHLSKKGYIKF